MQELECAFSEKGSDESWSDFSCAGCGYLNWGDVANGCWRCHAPITAPAGLPWPEIHNRLPCHAPLAVVRKPRIKGNAVPVPVKRMWTQPGPVWSSLGNELAPAPALLRPHHRVRNLGTCQPAGTRLFGFYTHTPAGNRGGDRDWSDSPRSDGSSERSSERSSGCSSVASGDEGSGSVSGSCSGSGSGSSCRDPLGSPIDALVDPGSDRLWHPLPRWTALQVNHNYNHNVFTSGDTGGSEDGPLFPSRGSQAVRSHPQPWEALSHPPALPQIPYIGSLQVPTLPLQQQPLQLHVQSFLTVRRSAPADGGGGGDGGGSGACIASSHTADAVDELVVARVPMEEPRSREVKTEGSSVPAVTKEVVPKKTPKAARKGGGVKGGGANSKGAAAIWRFVPELPESKRRATVPCGSSGCERQARYGYRNDRSRYCCYHRQEGMVVREHSRRVCEHQGCTTLPSFGYEWQKARFCLNHHPEGTVNVVSRRCSGRGPNGEECSKRPSYGLPWQKARYCAAHRTVQMRNYANGTAKCKGGESGGNGGGGGSKGGVTGGSNLKARDGADGLQLGEANVKAEYGDVPWKHADAGEEGSLKGCEKPENVKRPGGGGAAGAAKRPRHKRARFGSAAAFEGAVQTEAEAGTQAQAPPEQAEQQDQQPYVGLARPMEM